MIFDLDFESFQKQPSLASKLDRWSFDVLRAAIRPVQALAVLSGDEPDRAARELAEKLGRTLDTLPWRQLEREVANRESDVDASRFTCFCPDFVCPVLFVSLSAEEAATVLEDERIINVTPWSWTPRLLAGPAAPDVTPELASDVAAKPLSPGGR